jgi:hypothetical protein
MLKRIIQSTCVGLASVVAGSFLIGFVGLSLEAMRTPANSLATGQQQVGWDLLVLLRQAPLWVWLVPIGLFAIGFAIGYAYFSKRQKRWEIDL